MRAHLCGPVMHTQWLYGGQGADTSSWKACVCVCVRVSVRGAAAAAISAPGSMVLWGSRCAAVAACATAAGLCCQAARLHAPHLQVCVCVCVCACTPAPVHALDSGRSCLHGPSLHVGGLVCAQHVCVCTCLCLRAHWGQADHVCTCHALTRRGRASWGGMRGDWHVTWVVGARGKGAKGSKGRGLAT